MTVTRQRLTFDEYLEYDNGADIRYEFDNGELVEMPPAIRLHRKIAQFLEGLNLTVDQILHQGRWSRET